MKNIPLTQHSELVKTGALPIRTNSLVFAVGSPHGITSNSWHIWIHEGSIYISCRDNMKEAKISLHGSGRWRMAYTAESGIFSADGNRAWTVWDRPDPILPHGVIQAFELLFPEWEIGITPEQRQERPTVWEKNKIYIESGGAGLITAVSLFVAPKGVNIAYKDFNSFPLASLPVAESSDVQIVPHQWPEGNLRQTIADAIEQARVSMESAGTELPPGAYGYFSGVRPDGCGFLFGAHVR